MIRSKVASSSASTCSIGLMKSVPGTTSGVGSGGRVRVRCAILGHHRTLPGRHPRDAENCQGALVHGFGEAALERRDERSATGSRRSPESECRHRAPPRSHRHRDTDT